MSRVPSFEGAAMPLEALPELAAYRDLVLATARALYQIRHPERQRLPKGFDSGLRLVLERVDEGSAVPIVSREVVDMPSLFPMGDGDEFEQARAKVEELISSVGMNSGLPPEAERQVLARFNAFGRSLGSDEAIVVGRPGQWFDDDSRAFDPAALECLGKLLGAVQEAFRLPTPYVYPTPEGQARAEWPGTGWEVVVNVDLQSREADLTAVNLGSDRVDEDHVVLGQPGGESRLGKFVVEHWQ